MLAMNTKKYSEVRQNWIETHNCCQSPIECICECGQKLGNVNYIFKHRQTKKHRDLMEKSDKEKIQERHDALPNIAKKTNAFYVKYPTPQ